MDVWFPVAPENFGLSKILAFVHSDYVTRSVTESKRRSSLGLLRFVVIKRSDVSETRTAITFRVTEMV